MGRRRKGGGIARSYLTQGFVLLRVCKLAPCRQCHVLQRVPRRDSVGRSRLSAMLACRALRGLCCGTGRAQMLNLPPSEYSEDSKPLNIIA